MGNMRQAKTSNIPPASLIISLNRIVFIELVAHELEYTPLPSTRHISNVNKKPSLSGKDALAGGVYGVLQFFLGKPFT